MRTRWCDGKNIKREIVNVLSVSKRIRDRWKKHQSNRRLVKLVGREWFYLFRFFVLVTFPLNRIEIYLRSNNTWSDRKDAHHKHKFCFKQFHSAHPSMYIFFCCYLFFWWKVICDVSLASLWQCLFSLLIFIFEFFSPRFLLFFSFHFNRSMADSRFSIHF